jgi:hypothetical protein
MKLSIGGKKIHGVSTWNINTVTTALKAARQRFRLTQSGADYKECERLYSMEKEMERWSKGTDANSGAIS